MRVIDCEQGSEEWHFERAGVITASMATTARHFLATGERSKAAEKYAFRLAVERIAGKPLDDTFSTPYMKRGNRLEDDARVKHEVRIGDLIEQVGMVKTDCGLYGASADGLIGKTGGAEYKCFLAPDKLMSVWLNGDIGDVMDQIQMNMWISDREWWHFGLYCPAMESVQRDLTIIPVMRDEEYIKSLVQDLANFNDLVEEYREKILNNNPDSIWMPDQAEEAANDEQDVQYVINL